MNKLRLILVLTFTALIVADATAQVPWWYIWAAPGTHVGGPGSGVPGKLVISPIETVEAGSLSALWTNITNLTDALDTYNGPDGSNTKQQKIIEAAIGKRVAGDPTALIVEPIDPLTLIRRRQMIQELKASPDAERYRHFILYFEAAQANEARERLYVERVNTLIKVDQTPLNWQERVRLMAQIGLLGAQHDLAQQEMVEIRNRARVKASLDRMSAAAADLNRLHWQQDTDAMLGAGARGQ